MSGTPSTHGQLMYGCGLRILECHRLWDKDIDFAQAYIIVKQVKGGNDRAIPVPQKVKTALKQHVEKS
ncbi:probable integrase, fragment [Desulfotalea psychrophila LSv54]|uniref:Probable integrase n=2 Tax=Desulfotalea psychrophila TaxID=84980 RepID=Q6ALA6_DESPS|nr:probable integrase, fragment [Desulfotalea psychrophila LSv54]